MKNVMMYAMVALIWVGAAGNAFALTLKSGEVLTTNADGSQSVVGAGETVSAQRNLDNEGYHIAAGMLFVKVDEVVAEIDIDDLVGKSDDEQRDAIRVAIGQAIGVEYVAGDVTVQDVEDGLLDETIGKATAIFDASEEALAAYEDKIEATLAEVNKVEAGEGSCGPAPCGLTPAETQAYLDANGIEN